jgi:hypothetical protein
MHVVHPGMKKSAGKVGFFSRPVHSFCYSDHFPGAGGIYYPQTTRLNYSEKKGIIGKQKDRQANR